MTAWREDKSWSDGCLPEIKAICGQHLIGEPPTEEDAERNTDLMVLRMDAVRIAVRVRRKRYMTLAYRGEFTIRSGRPSGTKTEMAKIIEGWGDYMFYGFADDSGKSLAAWCLCDLRVFRRWFVEATYRMPAGSLPGEVKENTDGSSSFRVFKWADMPGDFVVAKCHPWETDLTLVE